MYDSPSPQPNMSGDDTSPLDVLVPTFEVRVSEKVLVPRCEDTLRQGNQEEIELVAFKD
jgi:hypothetical protein